MRRSVILAAMVLVLAVPGCGRKLPPLPPAPADPVSISDLRFDGDTVAASVRTTVGDVAVTLLGKPKGICPHCTDDLSLRDTARLAEPGDILLKDAAPEAEHMVYRVAVEYGATRWMTPARIVVKRQTLP